MSIELINKLLNQIDTTHTNKTGNIYLNIIKNEFIMLQSEIVIPKIPVSKLSYTDALPIVEQLLPLIPQFLYKHTLLEQRQPANELHSLHFVLLLTGTVIDFYHVLRIDFKFGGDSSCIVDPGDNYHYPAYKTNRIYYKSRLVPTLKTSSRPLTPLKLIGSITTESDQFFHTYALFDDLDTSHITQQFLTILPSIFSIPQTLYPFIVMDYYTACMNVLNPTPEELSRALSIFEPLFFVIASRYIQLDTIIPLNKLYNYFPNFFEIVHGKLTASQILLQMSQEYFNRYSIFRDEQCMVKGWWQIVIN